MKRILIMLVLAFTAIVFVFSQFKVGPKAGVNVSKLNYENQNLSTKNGYGFQIGGFVKRDFNPSFFAQAELMYAQNRSSFDVDIVEFGGSIHLGGYTITANYLLIPVMGGYKFGNSGFYVEAGFQPAIFLDSRYHVKNKVVDVDVKKNRFEDWNSVVVSMVGGFGYKFKSGLAFSARYCHGLTNNTHFTGGIESMERSLQFSVAYDLWSF